MVAPKQRHDCVNAVTASANRLHFYLSRTGHSTLNRAKLYWWRRCWHYHFLSCSGGVASPTPVGLPCCCNYRAFSGFPAPGAATFRGSGMTYPLFGVDDRAPRWMAGGRGVANVAATTGAARAGKAGEGGLLKARRKYVCTSSSTIPACLLGTRYAGAWLRVAASVRHSASSIMLPQAGVKRLQSQAEEEASRVGVTARLLGTFALAISRHPQLSAHAGTLYARLRSAARAGAASPRRAPFHGGGGA